MRAQWSSLRHLTRASFAKVDTFLRHSGAAAIEKSNRRLTVLQSEGRKELKRYGYVTFIRWRGRLFDFSGRWESGILLLWARDTWWKTMPYDLGCLPVWRETGAQINLRIHIAHTRRFEVRIYGQEMPILIPWYSKKILGLDQKTDVTFAIKTSTEDSDENHAGSCRKIFLQN